MGTKGPSNRYGNSNGSTHGKPTEHINYAWAKDFNKHSLTKHYYGHNNDKEFKTIESYRNNAIRFVNDIDRKNYKSFVNKKTGITYKYSPKTNEFIAVDKNGFVVTYYKPEKGYSYYKKQIIRYTKKEGNIK